MFQTSSQSTVKCCCVLKLKNRLLKPSSKLIIKQWMENKVLFSASADFSCSCVAMWV